MQNDFNGLYIFLYGVIFIVLDITGKPRYLSFHWYLIWHDCFAETCARWVNWAITKIGIAKLDRNFNRWYEFVHEFVFLLLGIFDSLFVFPLIPHLLLLFCRNKGSKMGNVVNMVKSYQYLKFSIFSPRISVQWKHYSFDCVCTAMWLSCYDDVCLLACQHLVLGKPWVPHVSFMTMNVW